MCAKIRAPKKVIFKNFLQPCWSWRGGETAILEHLIRWILKIFFYHGEGEAEGRGPYRANLEHLRRWFWKFSSIMTKVKGRGTSHSRVSEKMNLENFLQPRFLKIFFNHGEGKGGKSQSRAPETFVFEKFLQPWWRWREGEQAIPEHLRRWILKIFFIHGEGEGKGKEPF